MIGRVSILWDEQKNMLLKKTRNVSFERAAMIIQNHEEIEVLENPVHIGQVYYIVNLNDYIHVVPAVVNADGNIVLKTIFPSRKYHKRFGEAQ
jgi:uncharacterized DUF497 family protein